MYRRLLPLILCLSLLAATQTGCWSSKEIEDLALYVGLALDKGELTKAEQELEDKGITYSKQNKITATIQVVPVKTIGSTDKQGGQQGTPYQNVSGTGDSVLEIFRQFSIRNERPIVGHHLKVIVISAELLKQQSIEQLMDFVLRDNDIRPSSLVFISQGRAEATMFSKRSDVIPSVHIRQMLRNQRRTSKVMSPMILSKLDALIYSKRSFALQNLVTADGETEFAGAAVVKGDTGHWVGNLNQEDTECLSWLTGKGDSGVIKAYDWDNEPMTYEMKAMKSKIKARTEGDEILFEVSLKTEGRLIETWNTSSPLSSDDNTKRASKIFQDKLKQMMEHMIGKLQQDYKADVAGFSKTLSIQQPQAWNKVKAHWDETFSRSRISFKYDLKITDFGSFTE
ncbi:MULTISPECIES: Ger(x)C family spore germination protein [unclassified Paenibacillus]|uniref:Ger(x)C family spore germination protein n=1 Tax=unclassified Paenibacillus TaxID=185978 RepID=UPI0024064E45|nr:MULTISPECIES: Ger(x)C family spore germination protein [unclassified Paenibacillus]MDF9842512.1 spore germination protein [Paenibacillus sp. PastF-2]MDF9849102.1 spore germination protein [Paenibacillus sp. PastM-2]MDF9855672.1 spore germination protein [Paenibacillus sp. PastF-1]MDH6480944.1 spore germination protein [Paenibacillus sp. PastH-2]MDH6508366.1 spore germination protein [Paenibacillus sp. PastM-3]